MPLSDVEHRMPKAACTACGQRLDMASGVDGDARPTPGDLSVCIHCANVMTFTNNLLLRTLTTHELAEAMLDPDVARAVAAVTQMNRARKGRRKSP